MDFAEEIKQFSNRVIQIRDKIQTEEAVKDIIEISKYTKTNFNVDEIYESASELR